MAARGLLLDATLTKDSQIITVTMGGLQRWCGCSPVWVQQAWCGPAWLRHAGHCEPTAVATPQPWPPHPPHAGYAKTDAGSVTFQRLAPFGPVTCRYLSMGFGPGFLLTAASGMHTVECRRQEGKAGLVTITVATSVGSRSFGTGGVLAGGRRQAGACVSIGSGGARGGVAAALPHSPAPPAVIPCFPALPQTCPRRCRPARRRRCRSGWRGWRTR